MPRKWIGSSVALGFDDVFGKDQVRIWVWVTFVKVDMSVIEGHIDELYRGCTRFRDILPNHGKSKNKDIGNYSARYRRVPWCRARVVFLKVSGSAFYGPTAVVSVVPTGMACNCRVL